MYVNRLASENEERSKEYNICGYISQNIKNVLILLFPAFHIMKNKTNPNIKFEHIYPSLTKHTCNLYKN